MVAIYDLEGITLQTFNRALMEMIRAVAKIGSDNFPESLEVSYIINTPLAFSAVWAIMKHFFEEETRKKV